MTLSLFALAAAIGYLARRLVERYQEHQRERAVLALSGLPRKRRSRKRIENLRATWAMGALTGWATAAYVFKHGGWESLIWALLGAYGLVDVARFNAKLTRASTRKRSR